MHLDYRCYIKFRNPSVWKSVMQKIEMQDRLGKDHSFLEISEIFTDPRQMMRMMTDPMGEIFDTLNANEEIAFAFVHDHRKSPEYFEGLTEYIIDTIIEEAADDAIVIADFTDFDDDSVGDYVFYYFGGGKDGKKSFHIEGPDGYERHDIEINSFEEFLGSEMNSLSSEQKNTLKEFMCDVTNLMDNMQFMDMGVIAELAGMDEDEE